MTTWHRHLPKDLYEHLFESISIMRYNYHSFCSIELILLFTFTGKTFVGGTFLL